METTACSTAMDVEVDDGVDIGVPQLLDYLSDRLTVLPLIDVRESPNAMKTVASSRLSLAVMHHVIVKL